MEYFREEKVSVEYTGDVGGSSITPKDLKELAKKEHHIAIASSENAGLFTGLNLFQGSSASSIIEKAFNEFSRVLGRTAKWAFSTSLLGRHPALLRKAYDLDMKVACWSTFVQFDGKKL